MTRSRLFGCGDDVDDGDDSDFLLSVTILPFNIDNGACDLESSFPFVKLSFNFNCPLRCNVSKYLS